MKSEAIKSATTAATKNALASFNFTAFFFYSNRFALADFDLDKLIEDEELGDDNQTLDEQEDGDTLDEQEARDTLDSSIEEEDAEDLESQPEDEEPTTKHARLD